MSASPWLVVGLGNPGPAYAWHRHNIGHLVADELGRRAGSGFGAARKLRADVCETRMSAAGTGMPAADAQRVVVMKPRVYMNESGGPVAKVAGYHHVPVERIIAIHDELDLDFGQLRMKRGGGDNGHNGLRSMRSALGSGDFHRVRFGIGRPPGRQQPADFVLSDFPAKIRTDVEVEIARAADAVEALVVQGLTEAQNLFNR